MLGGEQQDGVDKTAGKHRGINNIHQSGGDGISDKRALFTLCFVGRTKRRRWYAYKQSGGGSA